MERELSRNDLICKISEVAFILDDLRLFLDTHKDCNEALEDYNATADKYKHLVKEYIDNYGPLVYYQTSCPEEWQWVKYPWPWEGEC